MKANEAPEKIYLERILCSNEVYDNWKAQKTISDDIEYTRTDAFIEKTISWLKEQDEMVGVSFQEDFLERFKNHMKGE